MTVPNFTSINAATTMSRPPVSRHRQSRPAFASVRAITIRDHRAQSSCISNEVRRVRTPPLTDPGWNLHTPAEVCIDRFQADRAPDHRYRTSPIGALFTHFKGGFYHDGRFPTLASAVDHYNACLNLNLSTGEKSDLIHYLLSLTFGESN
jgi:hypothetical protein